MIAVGSNNCILGQSVWFKAELIEAEEERLSVEADVLDGSNVGPVRLRKVYGARMTLMNKGRGMTHEIVQRSEAPNDA